MVNIKAVLKLFSVMILAFGSIFICTIFLNYAIDIKSIAHLVDGAEAQALYDAQIVQNKVILACAGGVLGTVALLVLFFSIGRFIDENSSELGVLKALGYSSNRLAAGFFKFGLSILIAGVLAYLLAAAVSPVFYKYLNEGLPSFRFGFNWQTPLILVAAPTIVFSAFSILFARIKLRKMPLDLITGTKTGKVSRLTARLQKMDSNAPFLGRLRRNLLFSNLLLIFFIGFAAFGFSSMIQMAFTMNSVNEGWLMPSVFVGFGIVMGFVTLLLSLSFIIDKNKKYLALLKAYGYTPGECNLAVFGGYRIVTYIGFAIGTLYQFFLMKGMTAMFAGAYENVPEVTFSIVGFFVTLALFVTAYEFIMLFYRRRIAKIPLGEVME